MIDDMIELLRKEGLEDIAHRDRCQDSQFKIANDKEDLSHTIQKDEKSLEVLKDDAKALETKISDTEKLIKESEKAMEDRLKLRNDEEAAYKKALKDDADAVELLGKAIEALT